MMPYDEIIRQESGPLEPKASLSSIQTVIIYYVIMV